MESQNSANIEQLRLKRAEFDFCIWPVHVQNWQSLYRSEDKTQRTLAPFCDFQGRDHG